MLESVYRHAHAWLHICLEKVGVAYNTTTVEAETYVVVSQNGSCYHFRRFLRSARRYNFTLISSSSLKRRIESLHKSKVLFSFLALLAFKKWYIILWGLRNGAEIILIEKTQTVEHKCNCAFTEKGVVITLKLGRIDLNFGAKIRLEYFDLSQMALITL